MNRRTFIGSILATGVAPYIVTTSGLLMPIKALAVPTVRGFEYLRLDPNEDGTILRQWSPDGINWHLQEPLDAKTLAIRIGENARLVGGGIKITIYPEDG